MQETETGQGIGFKNCIRAGLKGLCVRMFVFINMHMHVFMSMCVLQAVRLKARTKKTSRGQEKILGPHDPSCGLGPAVLYWASAS